MLRRGLLQEHALLLSLINRILDVVLVAATGFVSLTMVFHKTIVSTTYFHYVLLALIFVVLIFPYFNIYTSWRGYRLIFQLRALVLAWCTVMIFLVLTVFLLGPEYTISRHWIILWSALALMVLGGFRVGIKLSLDLLRKHGWNQRRILVIGSSTITEKVIQSILSSTWMGLKIVGVFDDKATAAEILGYKIQALPEKLSDYVDQEKIDEIWITKTLAEEESIKHILYELRHSLISIKLVPDIAEFRLINHPLGEVAELPILELGRSPMSGPSHYVKALEDIILSTLILVLVSPLMLIIAVAIKLSSPGPVLFKQERHGWNGEPMNIYKFRTMKLHTDDPEWVTQATKHDSRVTRLGRFLRKTSLDELPQFINVLQGRMSIVGPRPHAVQHNEYYRELIQSYMQRHRVKPGLTGWAQVNGWRGETDTLEKMKMRVEYDLYYIENWSLWFDIKIIIFTLMRGFWDKNAY